MKHSGRAFSYSASGVLARRVRDGVEVEGELVAEAAFDFGFCGESIVATTDAWLPGGVVFGAQTSALIVTNTNAASSATSWAPARSDGEIIGFLGGVRVLRVVRDELQICDLGESPRVRIRSKTRWSAAAPVFSGAAFAALGTNGTGQSVVEVFKLSGARIHSVAVPSASSVSFGNEFAVTHDGTACALVNLRLGRVERVFKLPEPATQVCLDPSGKSVAVAHPNGDSSVGSVTGLANEPSFNYVPAPVRKSTRLPAMANRHRIEEVPFDGSPLLALRRQRSDLDFGDCGGAESFRDDSEHLDATIEAVAASVAVAISHAWDTGELSAGPSEFPGQDAVRAALFQPSGAAASELEAAMQVYDERAETLRRRRAATLAAGRSLALIDVASEAGLSHRGLEILSLVAAAHLSARVAKLLGVLAGDVDASACTVGLIESIAAGSRSEISRELVADAPLRRWGLIEIESHEQRVLAEVNLRSELIGRITHEHSRVSSTPTLSQLIVERSAVEAALEHLRKPQPARLAVVGRSGLGGGTLLRSLARREGLGVRAVTATSSELATELLSCYTSQSVPIIENLELLDSAGLEELGRICNESPGPVFLRGACSASIPAQLNAMVVALETPTEPIRAAAWVTLGERLGRSVEWSAADSLARRYRVGPAAIHKALEGASTAPSEEELVSELRRGLTGRLAGISEKVSRLASWDRVVLPVETKAAVRELISRGKNRRRVLDEWGFDRKLATSRGLTALFAGPPGTGKTLVAGLVARELGLDLYRVDLSQIASKWIGETQKNLARLFDAADAGQAVILFDEADSLFSKRGEVKTSTDRHSNMEVNYLLQRLDSFEGIAILTTNLPKSIDGAFKRRLSMRVDFRLPDANTRADIWRAHIPAELPIEDGLPLDEIAEKYEMSGSYIRNSIVRAAFLAASEHCAVSEEHIEQAVLREYYDSGRISAEGPLF